MCGFYFEQIKSNEKWKQQYTYIEMCLLSHDVNLFIIVLYC